VAALRRNAQDAIGVELADVTPRRFHLTTLALTGPCVVVDFDCHLTKPTRSSSTSKEFGHLKWCDKSEIKEDETVDPDVQADYSESWATVKMFYLISAAEVRP
jgi:hypothetical protein